MDSEACRSDSIAWTNVWYIISDRTTGKAVSRKDGPRLPACYRIERSGMGRGGVEAVCASIVAVENEL